MACEGNGGLVQAKKNKCICIANSRKLENLANTYSKIETQIKGGDYQTWGFNLWKRDVVQKPDIDQLSYG